MAWSTPRVSWGVDLVGSADMNRIEENIRTLGKGGGGQAPSVPVVNPSQSGSNYLYDISSSDSSVFDRDGSAGAAYISHISITDRQIGNRIMIANTAVGLLTLQMSTAEVSDYKPIRFRSLYVAQREQYDSFTLQLMGDYWLLVDQY